MPAMGPCVSLKPGFPCDIFNATGWNLGETLGIPDHFAFCLRLVICILEIVRKVRSWLRSLIHLSLTGQQNILYLSLKYVKPSTFSCRKQISCLYLFIGQQRLFSVPQKEAFNVTQKPKRRGHNHYQVVFKNQKTTLQQCMFFCTIRDGILNDFLIIFLQIL